VQLPHLTPATSGVLQAVMIMDIACSCSYLCEFCLDLRTEAALADDLQHKVAASGTDES
jgi:hypothetical protein